MHCVKVLGSGGRACGHGFPSVNMTRPCYTCLAMGQIVIDIPTKANRRYVVTNKATASELLASLEESAIRVKGIQASQEELEYIEDVRDIEEGLAEYRRTGKTYRWEDIEAEIGL